MRTLVVGWFSFEQGHATAGDLLTRDLVCEWLESASFAYDIAVAPPFQGGVDWRLVEPQSYSHVVFVCGPFEKGKLETEFLSRFSSHRLIGLNLSMSIPLDAWNPFDFLIERDSSADAHPDIAFLSRQPHVPVIGVCLVESYPGALTEVANAAIRRLVASREMSVVTIDTRLDVNSTGLRNPAEIESLMARMDALVTTRLHGLVLALKNSKPALAIDPMAGGAKIRRQAETIGWPVTFNADDLSPDVLQNALDYCLTEAARAKAQECRQRAVKLVEEIRDEFILTLTDSHELESKFLARTNAGRNPSGSFKYSHSDSKYLETKILSYSIMNLVKDAKGLLRRVAWRLLGPRPLPPPAGQVHMGHLRRLTPISREFGYDRGQPIDRYYIENFLSRHADDIRGCVLEIGDNYYTRTFGGRRVIISDVLHVAEGNPEATIVGDLTCAGHISSNAFDCIILTQTLHLIYDVKTALQTLHRILKPSGILLATFPGVTQISTDEWSASWYWAFTTLSARRLFEETFPAENVRVEAYGNVLAATAFLHGLSMKELHQEELDYHDPCYNVLIALRAVKAEVTP